MRLQSGLEIPSGQVRQCGGFPDPGRPHQGPRTSAARSRAASARCSSSAWASSTAAYPVPQAWLQEHGCQCQNLRGRHYREEAEHVCHRPDRNAYHQTCRIRGHPGRAHSRGAAWKYAKSRMAKVPLDQADILFVDETGKGYQRRAWTRTSQADSPVLGISRPFFQRIAVFDLTDQIHATKAAAPT